MVPVYKMLQDEVLHIQRKQFLEHVLQIPATADSYNSHLSKGSWTTIMQTNSDA